MGILKTAMMSGAAMYGVNQIAKTASSRDNNSSNHNSNAQNRGAIDPEYLEYLEYKRRSAQSAPPNMNQLEQDQARAGRARNQDRYSRESDTQRQNLYLTQDPNAPPCYDYPYEDRRELSGTRYQPMDFLQPRQQSGFVEGEIGQSSRSSSGRADIGALIGQGMGMLQPQGGSGGKGGDFVSKFLNK